MTTAAGHPRPSCRPRQPEMGQTTLAWLSAAGLGFWFLTGFPFGNHNESYYWVARFAHERGWDIVWTKTLAATPRPLGQALAYLSWQLSGGSIWPAQIFNFALAALALYLIALVVSQTRTFALAMIVVGASFFTGYIYLFHLHGIFYSPVLVLIAALLYVHEAGRAKPALADAAACASALAFGLLFHPYSLIIFLGYIAGLSLERWRESSITDRLRRMLLALLATGTLAVSRPPSHEMRLDDNVRALITSYALSEISPFLSIISAALAAVTIFGIASMPRRTRSGLIAAVPVGAALLTWMGLPTIALWIAAAILKAAYLGNWTLAGMTTSAALLPVIAPSGSPTYAVFAVLMSTIVLAWGSAGMEQGLERLRTRWLVIALLPLALLAGMLRAGVDIPIASRLAQPLLAEQEKTRQLELVIAWLLTSEYRDWRLALEDSANPADDATDAIDRRHRPPTYQGYLDAFLASRRPAGSDRPTALVTFGTRNRESMTLLKALPGRFAGEARVFKQASACRPAPAATASDQAVSGRPSC